MTDLLTWILFLFLSDIAHFRTQVAKLTEKCHSKTRALCYLISYSSIKHKNTSYFVLRTWRQVAHYSGSKAVRMSTPSCSPERFPDTWRPCDSWYLLCPVWTWLADKILFQQQLWTESFESLRHKVWLVCLGDWSGASKSTSPNYQCYFTPYLFYELLLEE